MLFTAIRKLLLSAVPVLSAVIFLLFLTVSLSAQANQQAVLEKDLKLLLEWFPGRYDSSLQVFWQPELGIPEDERNYQRHTIFREVELPEFGEHVFYAEQSRDGDLDNIYRQRIYVFTTDLEENAVRLRVHVPKNTEKLKGAYRDLDLLKDLKPEDTITWDGCDLFWERQPNQFIGRLKEGSCRFTSKQFKQEILLDEYLILSPSALWFADKGTSLDGEYLFGMKGDTPSKSLKVRPFECWASILRGAQHGDSGESADINKDDWNFHRGLWFHDQGGEILIQTDEQPSRDIRLVLRRVEWPTKNNRPSLVLNIFEGESDRATSYSWTELDSKRIGINLRWLQASCSHAPDRIYEDGR